MTYEQAERERLRQGCLYLAEAMAPLLERISKLPESQSQIMVNVLNRSLETLLRKYLRKLGYAFEDHVVRIFMEAILSHSVWLLSSDYEA